MKESLIDKASRICGSDAALARKLDTSRTTVNKLRAGSMKISPETAALLAEIVGSDPYRAAAEAMIAGQKDPKKAERLTKAFHFATIAGVVTTLLFSSTNADEREYVTVTRQLTSYTLWKVLGSCLRLFVLIARRTIEQANHGRTRRWPRHDTAQGLKGQTLIG